MSLEKQENNGTSFAKQCKVMKVVEVKIRKITPEELEKIGIEKWARWEKEPSKFEWYYDSTETFYVFEGEVEVTLENGEKVSFGEGDLVTFPKGTKCTWNVKKTIKKAYTFD